MAESKPDSYNQILKSTSIIGGAAGINLLLGMVRMKFAAVLIGPAGVGLVGTYQAIQGMVGTVAGLGIQQSAVRDIAKAVGKGDDLAIGRTILSLRRICWLTGIIGMIAMIALAVPLSQYTFGSDGYALDIALLGPIIFFANIQGGQAAVLQGMRRIGDLARLTIIGAAVGTVVAVALYSFLGARGIIPSLFFIALIQLIATWHFARRVAVPKVHLTWQESFHAANSMIRLGLVFMWNGLMVALVAYLTRSWISQELDLVAVGIFTAAFSLSGMFINFILGAMSADYYPRLTEISHDHSAMRRLVNEQTEIGLLLAVPGLLATLTFAPWIIRVFFTGEFLPAADLLQWFILGCLARVISWPLAFVMLALAKSRWFFVTETSFNLLHLAMIWVGLIIVGIEGVAIAFFCLYVLYIAVVYGVARHLIGFRWECATLRLLFIFLPLSGCAFIFERVFSLPFTTAMGMLVTSIATLLCVRGLVQRIGDDSRIVQLSFRIPGVRWVCEF
ncbi:MAG: O-antigen translocase [Pseudomonadales bacterium]|nr:O-antigen translocase [Pseudomonadales bacterium]